MMQELSLNILDLAENSVAAGARLVEIEVAQRREADELTIAITDDGHGMDEALLREATSPFATTRTSRKVGLGIPLMKQTAEECGGGIEIESTPGVGTRLKATFGLTNIDRPPMGDLAGTMLALIAATPEGTDFTLTYRVDEASFAFDTQPVRELMGSIPLTNPEVYEWISGALYEGIESIDGGA